MNQQKEVQRLEKQLEKINDDIVKICQQNFSDMYRGLIHLKTMIVFIEGVLRFGIPPKFFMGVIQPKPKMEQKVFKNLEVQFAEEHLKEIYGEKQDV